jgi:hypothetical protein
MELKKHYKENTKEAASSLSKVLNMHISPSTLWRYRMDMQVYKCKSRKRYQLRSKNKKSRLEYCKKYLEEPMENWWFSDAVWIGVSKSGHVIWWSSRWGAPPTEIKYDIKPIFLWAAVSTKGMTDLIPISGKMNHIEYLNMLQDVLPIMKYYSPTGMRFLTDWWSVTTAKKNRTFLKDQMGWIDDFPVKSGDLNLIEYIWSWLKKKLEQKTIVYQSDLLALANDIWADLTPQIISAFLKHLKEYMRAVICNGGNYVNELFQKKLKRRKVVDITSAKK